MEVFFYGFMQRAFQASTLIAMTAPILGLTLILLGWALYLSHLLAFVLVQIFIVYIARFQIQPEERMLTKKFGQAYQNYRSKVRRWI